MVENLFILVISDSTFIDLRMDRSSSYIIDWHNDV